MQIRFDNRVVFVTGAAQGIGIALGTAFKQAGARVHLADIDAKGVERAGGEVGCHWHAADLADKRTAAQLIEFVIATEGRVDVLALAAGGVGRRLTLELADVEEEDWTALFRANVDSAFWLTQAAAPFMRQAGWGRIVTISSGAGLRPSATGVHGYTAAKHALIGLTKQLSAELAKDGITVNSIAPGLVLSSEAPRRQWESYSPDRQARTLESIHTRRLATPSDIAAATLFLASEQAGSITGQVLSVDGGRS